MTDPDLLELYERRFKADPDPWAFDTSPYERDKRAATIAACGDAARGSVLELGAANGTLAAELAAAAGSVVAIEAVPAAAALLRERLAPWPAARAVEGLIPQDVPAGPYDLVVASEILYYLDASAYVTTLTRIADWVAPGGRLVAVHWRPTGPERPRSADDVHLDLFSRTGLREVDDRSTADYRLTVLEHEG